MRRRRLAAALAHKLITIDRVEWEVDATDPLNPVLKLRYYFNPTGAATRHDLTGRSTAS